MAALAFEVVDRFEKELAAWCGSKYAIAVESGTAAIFLSLMYWKSRGGYAHDEIDSSYEDYISIPKFTYPSVPCSIIHAGYKVEFRNEKWEGMYELGSTGIWDSALKLEKGMYKHGLVCLSFHAKKLLPIGRGGMILTDDYEAYKWLRKARFDGRDEVPLGDDELTMLGWNMYLSPELAARGLMLFDVYKNHAIVTELDPKKQSYPDLSKFKIYQGGSDVHA